MSGVIDLDEIAGARATHKFARLSASKARVVLDLIRDEDLDRARDALEFCDRGAADVVSKVLESAVSNAEHNENLVADELYVAECWADEGPTLKRWRPRARGRATRINKRTCHITVVVAQLDDEELAEREARRIAAGARGPAADRAARVAASRGTEEAEVAEADVDEADVDEADVTNEVVEEAAADGPEADGGAEEATDDAEQVEAVAESAEDDGDDENKEEA